MKKRKHSFFMTTLPFILLVFFTEKSLAACVAASVTTPPLLSLGVQSAASLATGGITSAMAQFDVNCSATLLSLDLLSTATNPPFYRATTNLLLTSTGSTDQIPYRLGANTTFNPAITQVNQTIGENGSFQLLSLALLGSKSFTLPVFAQTLAVTRWPKSGYYSTTQTLSTGGSICTSVSILFICLTPMAVSGNVSLQIGLTVEKTCEFGTVDSQVNFGNHPFVRDIPAQTLNAQVRCTNQDTYRLYATNGAHYGNGRRQMDRGGQQKIGYEIYHPGSTTQILSASNPQQRTGTGLIETVALPVRVLPGQATPMIGEYSDSIQLVLEF